MSEPYIISYKLKCLRCLNKFSIDLTKNQLIQFENEKVIPFLCEWCGERLSVYQRKSYQVETKLSFNIEGETILDKTIDNKIEILKNKVKEELENGN